MDPLRTERLILRPFRGSDLPLYAALNAHPQVADALGGPLSREDSDDIALWANQLWGPAPFGLVAIERAADGAFLGMCGLHHLKDRPGDTEIGWRLDPAHWGQGYATEAGRAWLEHGFGTLGLERIISVTDEPNVRSLAVMRRLGLRFLENDRVEDNGTWIDAVVYAMTREEWAA